MATLASIILRDTRANQPAAGTAGRLYYVTDESVLERDSGSAWQSVEGAGGLADHGVVTYFDFTNASAPSTPASGKTRIYTKTDKAFYQKDDAGVETALGGSGGAPATAKYLTVASDGTLSAEVVIPGLAGSADISGAAGGGISEEYDSGSSGLTWGTAPATEDSNTTILSHLYTKWTATTLESLGTRAWAPGSGAFDARTKIGVGADSGFSLAFGLHIGDSGNSNRLLLQLAVDTTNHNWNVAAYTYASGSYTARGGSWTGIGNALYLRIKRDGSNNCSFFYSVDGLTWNFMATQSFSLTVSNIGYRANAQATVTAAYMISDWLRTSV